MTDILQHLLPQTLSTITGPGLVAIILIMLFLIWLLRWFVKLAPQRRRDVIELIRAMRRQ